MNTQSTGYDDKNAIRVCCPECHSQLSSCDHGAMACSKCGLVYPATRQGGAVDMRPKRRFSKTALHVIDPVDPLWTGGDHSESDFAKRKLGATFQNLLPKGGAGTRALEVGCGPRRDIKRYLQQAGYQWTGVDWEDTTSTYLADIHALPFETGTFDLIASDAVLEHVRYPHVAIQEMARMIKPGGYMIGEVAFLQPYHVSYYHMTHGAILDLVRYAGLELIAYNDGEISSMDYLCARYLGVFSWLVWPASICSKWLQRRRQPTNTDIIFACSVVYLARKPLT